MLATQQFRIVVCVATGLSLAIVITWFTYGMALSLGPLLSAFWVIWIVHAALCVIAWLAIRNNIPRRGLLITSAQVSVCAAVIGVPVVSAVQTWGPEEITRYAKDPRVVLLGELPSIALLGLFIASVVMAFRLAWAAPGAGYTGIKSPPSYSWATKNGYMPVPPSELDTQSQITQVALPMAAVPISYCQMDDMPVIN
eukprot:m51a1_g10030 hypothetical protein (197) ;mRNA; r:115027-120362